MALLCAACFLWQTHVEPDVEPHYPRYFGPNWYNAVPASPDLPVSFSMAVELGEGTLIVSYSVWNHGEVPLDIVGRPSREWDGGDREAQIDVYRGRLMLSRILLPEHHGSGADCDGYRTPEVVTLDPGAVTTGNFRIPLPAQVNVSMREPWLERRNRTPILPKRSRWTNRVTLIVGVILEPYQIYDQVTLAKTITLPRPIEVLDDDEEP